MENLKFGVVVPLYNKEKYIGDAMKSVLAQTYENYELVVVDDGSTDSSLEIAKTVAKSNPPKIKIIAQDNAGECAARNAAMKACRCDYYAFLDADDIWAEDHLSCLAQAATAYPDADLLVTAYTVLLDRRIAYSSPKESNVIGCKSSYWLTLTGMYDFVWSSAAAVSTRAVKRCGYFMEGVKIGGDLEYWARIAETNPLVGFSAKRSAFYNRCADGNARTSVKVAHAGPFMDRLKRQASNLSLTDEERRAITNKYAKKQIVYIFTTTLSGDRSGARQLISEWNLGASKIIKILLYISTFIPQCINEFVFRVRLKVQ